MPNLIEKDENEKRIYRGFLSSEETLQADLLLGYLQEEIPNIAKLLNEKYGDGVLYKYFLGKRLGELLDEYNISEKDRVYFWNEIKNFASDKERKRNDGGEARTRKFYEQCFLIAQLEKKTVEKMSWRQWQDLFDRRANREDKRIFTWIGVHEPKIKEQEWRAFEKGLNLFLKGKDTSVFEEDELYEIYEMNLCMGQEWIRLFTKFSKDYPKSLKIKTKSKWETKFYELCFKCRKANKSNINNDDFEVIFNTIMKLSAK